MARAPLVLETAGKIRRTKINGQHTAIANYRDSDGVTRKMQRSGRTAAQAEDNLKEAIKERLAPSGGDLDKDTTVATLAEKYVKQLSESDRAIGTQLKYERAVNKYVLPGLGQVRMHELNVPRLDRFLDRIKEHHGIGSARTCRVVLSAMLNIAARKGAIESNLIRDTETYRPPKKLVSAPTVADVHAIRALLKKYDSDRANRNGDLADTADIYAATGARTAEVLAAQWAEVRFDSDPIEMDIVATLVTDKNGKLLRQDRPKTAKSMRGLKIPPFGAEILLRRRVDAMSEYIFPSRTGGAQWANNFRRRWRDALRGSPFEGLTPRDYRKAVATLLRDEMGAEVAQEQLGHESKDTTEKHYIVKPSEGPDATAALQKFGQNGE